MTNPLTDEIADRPFRHLCPEADERDAMTPAQLDALNRGGFIELIQYAPRMVMHSMTVWDVPTVEGEER